MHATHGPLSLADIGQLLWGARWMEPLAVALGVTERDVVQWSAKPHTMPPSVHEQIKTAAKLRLQEIHEGIARLDENGIKGSRSRELTAASLAAHPRTQLRH